MIIRENYLDKFCGYREKRNFIMAKLISKDNKLTNLPEFADFNNR